MTVGEALNQAQSSLQRADIDSYRIDSLILLEHTTGQPRANLIAHPEAALSDAQSKQFFDLINKRCDRLPMAQILGQWEFYGLTLKVTAGTLTPRVETEKMVDWAIKYAPRDSTLIDIGTGTGAIAIAIKKQRPDLKVTASEVSTAALEVAQANAETHNVEINFVTSDLWANVDGRFATICTNLPYLQDDADLMPEVTKEPSVALFGGPDGLGLYRRFLAGLPKFIERNGFLFTECDPWQQPDLINEAAKINLQSIEQDYFILGFQMKSA